MFVRPPTGFEKERAANAVAIALDFARRSGVAAERGELISEGANLLVRLEPGPTLARISNWVDMLRVEGSLEWNRREVILARHLAGAGMPVARPLVEPVREDGITKSIWTWLEHEPNVQPSDVELGVAVARLHDALAGCSHPLIDFEDVLREVRELAPRAVIEGDATLTAVADALPRKVDALLRGLEAFADAPRQALHGDAHAGNIVGIDDEVVWIDFEDTCRGPVEYDLATAILQGPPSDRTTVLASYARPVDDGLLDLMLEARRCQVACWSALLLPSWREQEMRDAVERWLAANG